MGEVKSDAGIAGDIANSIQAGANGISDAGTVSKDGTSYYQGNTKASSYIDKENQYSIDLSSTVTQLIASINNIHSDFEAMDVKISTEISSNTNSTKKSTTPRPHLFPR